MQPLEQKRHAERDPVKDFVKDPDRGQTKFDLVLASFQRLLRRGAITNLVKMLGRMHPADIAKVIEHLSSPKEKRTVFELVRGEAQRGQVLSELDAENINHVLADMSSADVAALLKDLGTDDVAYVLGVLPEERSKEIFIEPSGISMSSYITTSWARSFFDLMYGATALPERFM